MKGYVLMKVDWEYNDENYYRPEGEGGSPQKVFLDASKAISELNRLNKKEATESIPMPFEIVEVEIDETTPTQSKQYN